MSIWPDTGPLRNAIVDGDNEKVFEYYRTPVRNFLLILGVNPADADDGVQDVFIRVMASLPKVEIEEREFRAFLKMLCRNWKNTQFRKSESRDKRLKKYAEKRTRKDHTTMRPDDFSQVNDNTADKSTMSLCMNWIEEIGYNCLKNLLSDDSDLTDFQKSVLKCFLDGQKKTEIIQNLDSNKYRVNLALHKIAQRLFCAFRDDQTSSF